MNNEIRTTQAPEGSEYYRSLCETVFRNDKWDWVWHSHPWMVSAYTGRQGDADTHRYDRIMRWLHDEMGEPSNLFRKPPEIRHYLVGGGTVFGWTWIGFRSETDMQTFVEAWPVPDGVTNPYKENPNV